MLLTPGQAGDNPQLVPLLEAHKIQDATQFRLLADKAYSHPSTRSELRSRRIRHTIPERSDQIERRKAKGSAGGRPPAFDRATTRNATPWNAASTDSNTGAESQPATTSTPPHSSAAYYSQR